MHDWVQTTITFPKKLDILQAHTPHLPPPAARLSANELIPEQASSEPSAPSHSLPAIPPYVFDPAMLNLKVLLLLSAMHFILSLKKSYSDFSPCFLFFKNYYSFLLCFLVILYVRFMFLFIIFRFLCKSDSRVSFYLVFPSSSVQNKIKENKTVFCLCLSLKPCLPYTPTVLSMFDGLLMDNSLQRGRWS